MRENRTHGSEGGEGESPSLPLSSAMPDSNHSASCPVRIRKADLTAISGAIQSDVVREPKTWERGHLAIETPEGETRLSK